MIEQRTTSTDRKSDSRDEFSTQATMNMPAKGSLKSLLDRLDRDAPERARPDNDPAAGLREARRKIAEMTGADQPSALSQLASLKTKEAERAERARHVASPPLGANIADMFGQPMETPAAPQAQPQTQADMHPQPPLQAYNTAPQSADFEAADQDVSHVPVVVETDYEDEEEGPRNRKSPVFKIVCLIAAIGGATALVFWPQITTQGEGSLSQMVSVLTEKSKVGDVPRPMAAKVAGMAPVGGDATAPATVPPTSAETIQAAVAPGPANDDTSVANSPVAGEGSPDSTAVDVITSQQENEGISAVITARPGEKIALPINLDPVHVSADVSAVLIRGLPADYAIAGATGAGEGRWALLAEAIQDARLVIPATGAGRIKLDVDMFNAEAQRIAQTKIVIEVAAQNAQRRMSDEQMNQLLAQGKAQFAAGDVAAARLLFERAAEGGHGPSAFAMAETFEQERLQSMSVQGLSGDPARARHWYERAQALGMPQAEERLAQLSQQ